MKQNENMTTMKIPMDPRNNKIPMITNEMKKCCIGEFNWSEEDAYYDDLGEVHDRTVIHTVPWDLCKTIYKTMAKIAIASQELNLEKNGK